MIEHAVSTRKSYYMFSKPSRGRASLWHGTLVLGPSHVLHISVYKISLLWLSERKEKQGICMVLRLSTVCSVVSQTSFFFGHHPTQCDYLCQFVPLSPGKARARQSSCLGVQFIKKHIFILALEGGSFPHAKFTYGWERSKGVILSDVGLSQLDTHQCYLFLLLLLL